MIMKYKLQMWFNEIIMFLFRGSYKVFLKLWFLLCNLHVYSFLYLLWSYFPSFCSFGFGNLPVSCALISCLYLPSWVPDWFLCFVRFPFFVFVFLTFILPAFRVFYLPALLFYFYLQSEFSHHCDYYTVLMYSVIQCTHTQSKWCDQQ